MLRIRYKSRPDSPGFEYSCSRREAMEKLQQHMRFCCRETVDDGNGNEVTREIPASDLLVEWVEGEKIEILAVPAPRPKAKIESVNKK